MAGILGSIAEFALICLGFAAVLIPAYLVTRYRAQTAVESGDDSPAAAFFLWLHPDVCGQDGAHSDDGGDGGGQAD